MNLIAHFDQNGAGNPYFKFIYHSLLDRLKLTYPEFNFKHLQPDYSGGYTSPSSVGSYSMFMLYNEENNKTILLSFWDRTMEILENRKLYGWDKYDIVQLIGGLGMYKSTNEIYRDYNINHYPFQYPLGVPNSYTYIDELKNDYKPETKIRKAVFIGLLYDIRKDFYNYMKTHPLIDMFSADDGFNGKLYYEKMLEYKLVISLNGNGELAMRDFESMGLSLPVVRSEMKTQFHQPLIPDYHYLKSSPPSQSASFLYPGKSYKEIADGFIDVIEKNIDNDEKLINLSTNGYGYYNTYCRPEHIINLYFKIIDLNKLK